LVVAIIFYRFIEKIQNFAFSPKNLYQGRKNAENQLLLHKIEEKVENFLKSV
jgi:hypothetical protein